MLPELRDQENRGNVKELLAKHTAEYDYFNKTDMVINFQMNKKCLKLFYSWLVLR